MKNRAPLEKSHPLPPGYGITKTIETTTGAVYFLKNAANEQQVLKKIEINEVNRHWIRIETECLKRVGDYIDQRTEDGYCYITQRCYAQEDGWIDLKDFLATQPITHETLEIIKGKVNQELNRLTALGITHNDIKEDNFKYNIHTGALRAIDFGNALVNDIPLPAGQLMAMSQEDIDRRKQEESQNDDNLGFDFSPTARPDQPEAVEKMCQALGGKNIGTKAATLLSAIKKDPHRFFRANYRDFQSTAQRLAQLSQANCTIDNHGSFKTCLNTLLQIQTQFDTAFSGLDLEQTQHAIGQIQTQIQSNKQAIAANEKTWRYTLLGNASTPGQNNIKLNKINENLLIKINTLQNQEKNLELYTTARSRINAEFKAIHKHIETAKNTPVATEAVAEKATSPAESSTSWLSSLSLAATGAVGIVLASAATLLPYALSSLSSAMTEDPTSNTTFSP
jgi:serine/threonine protein kinase